VVDNARGVSDDDGDSQFVHGSSMKSNPSILLVSGEASGDQHGAALVRAFRERHPAARFWGMGGSALRAAGMELTHDAHQVAGVNGFTEVLGKIRGLLRTMKELLSRADEARPDAAVLIDFPDFNLRLAKKLRARGIPVFYFIAPQVWAWREGRVETMKKTVTELASIIPFEADYFARHGIVAHYVGHPYLDRAPITETREAFLSRHALPLNKKIVAILPGSRRSEVLAHLAPMVESLRLLPQQGADVHGVIPVPDTLDPQMVRDLTDKNAPVTVIKGDSRELLTFADAAIVKSGTSTVDAALAEVPFTVVYKVSPLTYWIAKTLVRGVRWVAMANLIAGKVVVREILQDAVTAPTLAAELNRLLTDNDYRSTIRSGLREVGATLRTRVQEPGTAGSRAATILARVIDKPR
jgi:lipid-A-disaccharide synthase